jgi:hypothetical protein
MFFLKLLFTLTLAHAETTVELKRGELPLPSLDLLALPVRLSEDEKTAIFSATILRKTPSTLILFEEQGKPLLQLKDAAQFQPSVEVQILFSPPASREIPTRFRFREIAPDGLEQSEEFELRWAEKVTAPPLPSILAAEPPPRPRVTSAETKQKPKPIIRKKPKTVKPAQEATKKVVVQPKASPKPAPPQFNENEPPPDLE